MHRQKAARLSDGLFIGDEAVFILLPCQGDLNLNEGAMWKALISSKTRLLIGYICGVSTYFDGYGQVMQRPARLSASLFLIERAPRQGRRQTDI